jgi:exportin-2 (importin alpha re-exporter)
VCVCVLLVEGNNLSNIDAFLIVPQIHLMMGIAIRRESTQGVSEINEAVNVMDFFQTQILPELQDANHASRPVVKATSIKFVSVFRKQFTRENLVQLLPLLIAHLASPIVVVHTFAAYTIERILLAKDDTTKQPKISSADFAPFVEKVFSALFVIIDNEVWNENDYVMKCVTRCLSKAGEAVIPVTQIVITKLTAALGRVAKNPRNPQFNHYLFESIAVLVGSVCSKDPSATIISTFEGLLFEPFNVILQMDIAEFTPYVFQVLAQLLEFRPRESGLGQSYTQLFPPLLTPDLWEKKGNVPALARLIQAYIKNAAGELTGSINPILGVFQKLLSLKATEGSAFEILSSAIVHFPQEAMGPRLGTIFQLILTKLMSSKTPKYTRLVTQFFGLFVGKYGAQVFFDKANAMQPGLAVTLLVQVWNPRILKDPPVQRMEAKVQVIGLTKLLCETPALLADANGQAIWAQTLAGVVTVLTSASFKSTGTDADFDDDVLDTQYDAQFSKLANAGAKVEDLFPEVTDPAANFVQSLHRLSLSQPGQLMPLIQQGLSADPKLIAGLESLFTLAGVRLA